jgi:hypothetical protein
VPSKRSIPSVEDCYQSAELIEQKLGEAGLMTWKAALDDAMSSASTGTEALMALRWNLAEMEKVERLPGDLPFLVRRLISDITILLASLT